MLATTILALALAALGATAGPVELAARQASPAGMYIHPLIGPCGARLNAAISRDSLDFISNGLPVFLSGGGRYQIDTWILPEGGVGPIKLNVGDGEQKCIDAGSNPANGIKLKVWDCYDGLTQQQWVIKDNNIKLRDFNLCMDVTDGAAQVSTVLQTWQCYPGNENQLFEVRSNFAR